MSIAVFARTGRPGPDALIEGAAAAGMPVVQQRPIFTPADGVIHGVTAVVLDGIRGDKQAVCDAYEAVGVPCYILELPRLRAAAGPDKTNEARLVGIYRSTLHDLPLRIGNTATVAGLLADRLEDYLLVCGQKPLDASHGMDADQCARWARETIALARRQYERPVCYRPHPRAVQWHDPLETFGADSVSAPTRETVRDALQFAWALVTYNSTTGVDAIDAGVPVFYTATPDRVAYAQYAARLGDSRRMLTAGERETLLLRCAAQCWTLAQLRDGTALRCLFGGAAWPEPQIVVQSPEDAAAREALALAAAHEFAQDAGVAV